MVWNVQAPWDVHPSPTLCGLCLKVLRGRNGDADKKPIPTLTKDENRPSGRTTGLRAEQAEPAGIRKGDTLKVFVLNMRGKPLMPCSPAKARHMLKAGKAVVVRRTPFTIKLTIATGETKQDVTLGVDAGARHVGISATTEKGGGLRVRSRASTGHHGTSGRSSGIPTCKAQSKDALPRSALQQSRSIKAQGMACAVR